MVVMPRVNVNTDISDGMCFGCGRNNPIGLKMQFRREGDRVTALFTPQEEHQGWPGVVHGGIIAAVIDEAMGYANHFAGMNCLTAKMDIKLKRPAPIGETFTVTSFIEKSSRRLVVARASISLPDGKLVAEGKATFFVIEHSNHVAAQHEEETGGK